MIVNNGSIKLTHVIMFKIACKHKKIFKEEFMYKAMHVFFKRTPLRHPLDLSFLPPFWVGRTQVYVCVCVSGKCREMEGKKAHLSVQLVLFSRCVADVCLPVCSTCETLETH